MPATATSYRPHVGVHLILTKADKVLLLRRANTGFADGSWSVPGGCLDEGETLSDAAAREAREETGIIIDPADLEFTHLCHHADPDGQSRVGVFFTAHRWTGEPVNAEPGKCSEIGWHRLDGGEHERLEPFKVTGRGTRAVRHVRVLLPQTASLPGEPSSSGKSPQCGSFTTPSSRSKPAR